MKKRIVCLTLALLMSAAQIVSVSASREDELREEQAWTSQQLDATYSRMNDLSNAVAQLQSEISELDSNLVSVMVSIDTLQNDISNKEVDIIRTKQDLGKAQKARDKQYEAMKKRIQYLYEKGGDDAWFQMMMGAENLADLLTRAEYTQKMYDQDRENLNKYVNTIEQVNNLKTQYESEKAELEEMKNAYEEQSYVLQNQIDEKKSTSSDYENEIAYAQQQATEYANLLEQQTAEIQQLEAERIAAEEEARRQAEEEAARQAAAEEAARQEAEAAASEEDTQEAAYDEDGNVIEEGTDDYSEDNTYDENGDYSEDDSYSEDGDYSEDDSYSEDGDYSEDGNASEEDTSSDDVYYEEDDSSSDNVSYDEYGNVIDSDNTVSADEYNNQQSSDSSSSYSGSGSAVVDYATQFVGNPYVWGGTSLTNGADCSGFVQSVYSNFGVSLPRTSYEQQNAGTEVSYADAQPGDLICYGGHVAIYMGNGQIVHASNSVDGIKISDNAAYRTILSVRRLV